MFAALLVLVGIILLAIFVTMAVLYSTPDQLYISLVTFCVQIGCSLALIALGTYFVIACLWKVSVSEERRNAIVARATDLEILNELRLRREDLPTVPNHPPLPGAKFPFRIAASSRNLWGLISSAVFTIIFVALSTILILTVYASLGATPNWPAIGLSFPVLFAAGWFLFQFFRQYLKLTGIGPTTIELAKYPLRPNAKCNLFISQPGRVRLRLLDIALVCKEQATYSQGTDIRTESKIIFREQLFKKRGINLRPGEPFETELEIEIPTNSMHSFHTPNNQIQWKLLVVAQAKAWPQLKRSYPIAVHPPLALDTKPVASR
jgi:hypothetical protein